MKKTCHFHDFEWLSWPKPEDVQPYFLGGPKKAWASPGGNDTWSFEREDVPPGIRARQFSHSHVILTMVGIPSCGVTLQHDQWDAVSRTKLTHNSKGDLSQLFQFVRNLHCDPLSIGLFVPFETAWLAVKQFLETGGVLPSDIEWVNSRDLPPEAFPLP